MDFPGIQITVVYAILSVAFLIAAFTVKKYRTLFCISGLVGSLGVILCALNLHIQSERLFIISAFAPLGLLMIVLGMNRIIEYVKCTASVSAEYIGYELGHHKGIKWRFPKFRYHYQGKCFVSLSFVSYSSEQFEKLFETRKQLTIHINPNKPIRCVDKRHSPLKRAIAVCTVGFVFMAFSFLLIFLENSI